MAATVKAIERHRPAASTIRPFDPRHLHARAARQRQGAPSRAGVDIGHELGGLPGGPDRASPTQETHATPIIGHERIGGAVEHDDRYRLARRAALANTG